jgi:hypothetical protein
MRFGFFGRPPSFPFARELRAFAAVEMLPMSAPTLIFFPQLGQFIFIRIVTKSITYLLGYAT